MNIVYLCNLIGDDVIEKRNNKDKLSQAANNKIISIKESLELYKRKVNIVSIGDMNNRTFKLYKSFKGNSYKDLIYSAIVDIPFINKISSCINSYRNIKKIHKKEKVDYVILYNYTMVNCIVGYLCKKIMKINIVIDYEESLYNMDKSSNIKRKIWRAIEERLSHIVDGNILVTSKLIGKCKRGNWVIARGVINSEIKMRAKKGKSINKVPTLMYSGGLDEDRGIKVLLESLKYVKGDFQLRISGTGDLQEYVKNFKDKRVKYLGFLDYKDIQMELINSDILVNPQLATNKFGNTSFPSKIFEYLSTNNLIISSNVSDIDDMHEGAFYIYNNDSSAELAEEIDKALFDLNNNTNNKKIKIEKLQKIFTKEKLGKELVEKIFI